MSTDVQYYRIKPTAIFLVAGNPYIPYVDYLLSPAVFNGKTDDGRNVADLCTPPTTEIVSFGPP